jgi:type II secretory pathway pseudopilin PulG
VKCRKALTFVELLVVTAIVAILFVLLLAAIQQSREAARRMACVSNLRQFGLAIANYEQTYGYLPPGTDNSAFSLHVRLLPYFEGEAIYHSLDFGKFYRMPPNDRVLRHNQPTYKCPSSPDQAPTHVRDYTNYVGSAGGGMPRVQNGVIINLGRSGLINSSDILDGKSSTAAMAEAVAYPGSAPGSIITGVGAVFKTFVQHPDLDSLTSACLGGSVYPTHRSLGKDWMSGSIAITRIIHVLPPNSPSCTNGQRIDLGIYSPSSRHPGGVNLLLADSAVRFVSQNIERSVWVALGSRAGAEIIQ